MKRAWFLILVSCSIAVLRIFGHKEIPFQALAHVWVGGLFGAFMVGMVVYPGITNELSPRTRTAFGLASISGILAFFLTVVEIVCFLYFKFG